MDIDDVMNDFFNEELTPAAVMDDARLSFISFQSSEG